MKKIRVYLVTLLTVAVLAACSGECKKCRGGKTESPIALGKVESIRVNFPGTLYLYQDTFQFASVAGVEYAILNINKGIENGVWDVYFPRCLTCEEDVEVVLVVPDIKQVEMVGTGRIIAERAFLQENITIINKGTGSIKFDNLKVDSLSAAIEGTGNIQLFGEGARVIQAEIGGTGDLELYQFPGLKVMAKITGAGNILTTAIDLIDAFISGTGNIYYKGSPEIKKEITGTGQIIKG